MGLFWNFHGSFAGPASVSRPAPPCTAAKIPNQKVITVIINGLASSLSCLILYYLYYIISSMVSGPSFLVLHYITCIILYHQWSRVLAFLSYSILLVLYYIINGLASSLSCLILYYLYYIILSMVSRPRFLVSRRSSSQYSYRLHARVKVERDGYGERGGGLV